MEILPFYVHVPEILKSKSWNSGFQTWVCITKLGSFLNSRSPDSLLRASNLEILEWGPGIFILTSSLENSYTGGPWTTYYGLGYKDKVKKNPYASPFQYGEKTSPFNVTQLSNLPVKRPGSLLKLLKMNQGRMQGQETLHFQLERVLFKTWQRLSGRLK